MTIQDLLILVYFIIPLHNKLIIRYNLNWNFDIFETNQINLLIMLTIIIIIGKGIIYKGRLVYAIEKII